MWWFLHIHTVVIETIILKTKQNKNTNIEINEIIILKTK